MLNRAIVTTLLLSVCLTAGCRTQMTDSRKFVTAVDSVNISMTAINRLYDQGIIADKDYIAASTVFFRATTYILEWKDSVAAGIDRPSLRMQVIELAKELAVIAIGTEKGDKL